MKHGPNWLLSRRAMLRIYDDHLECANWRIAYGEINNAILYSVRSLFIIPGFVLRIETPEACYHFGLNPNRYWSGDLPFEVTRTRGKLGYTKLSILVRAILAGYLLWLLWRWLVG